MKLRRAGRAGSAALVWVCLAGCPPSPRGFDDQELLWPEGAPGALGSRRHDEPRLFFYRPDPAIATDTAVIIASGGSYGHHGGLWPEGEPTARWLVDHGITAVIVRYRVGERGGYDHRAYMADGARAIQSVRARAEALGVAPDRIGFIGYSAGGHLAASLATRCPLPGTPSTATPIELPPDELSAVSCRPDFAVAVYPVITFEPAHVYERSRRNLLGAVQDPPQSLVDTLSVERQVTPTTAPMFVVHSRLDRKVDPANSELLYAALVAHGVPARLHMAEDGGHGVALAENAKRMPQMSKWPAEVLVWMQQLGKLELRRR
jgi:acetyl esterase/lipase